MCPRSPTLDTVSFISLPLALRVDFGAAALAPCCRHLLLPQGQGCSGDLHAGGVCSLSGSAGPVWWEGKWPGHQEQWALSRPVQLR